MEVKVKVISKLSSILLILAVFISCQPQQDINVLQSQVDEINKTITKAMLEGDFESILKLYTNDAISLPSYEPMIKGIEALKAQNEKQKEMPMNMKSFSLSTTDLWVSGNFVVEIGTYDLVMLMPADQGGEMPDKGKYLTLYEIQKDGSLLIKAETWNTDTNPWMDMMKHQEEMPKGN